MKKTTMRTLLLIVYWIPFAFIGMYGDAVYDTVWAYAFMVAELAVLCWVCMKYQCPEVIVLGNLITTISSYFCLQQVLETDQIALWDTYFKPLTPVQMLLVMTAVAALVQLLNVEMLKKRFAQSDAKHRREAEEKAAQSANKSHKKKHKKRK